MNCVVTAGPTFETLDNVRRLTNFSTGRLGTELANFLTARGHAVTLLLGEQATYGGARDAQRVERYTTTANLMEKLQALAEPHIGAVFHAAAVSDFKFGKIWLRSPTGELSEIKSGKIIHPRGPAAGGVVADAKNHRAFAHLVSPGAVGGLEIRGGRRPGERVAGGRAAAAGLPDRRVRGERAGLR